MPITLGDARTDLRQRLNEQVSQFFQDSDLNFRLNEGCRDVARKAKCLLEKQTIACSAGVYEYVAPTNLMEFHAAEFLPSGSINTYTLDFRPYAEMAQVWGSQPTSERYYPNNITLWGEPPNTQFILFPVPSAAGTLNVYYFRTPTAAVADTDNLDVPEGWWDLPILHALWNSLFKAHDPRWKDARQAYTDDLQFMIARADDGYSDAPGRFSYGIPNMPAWPWGASSEGLWF